MTRDDEIRDLAARLFVEGMSRVLDDYSLGPVGTRRRHMQKHAATCFHDACAFFESADAFRQRKDRDDPK